MPVKTFRLSCRAAPLAGIDDYDIEEARAEREDQPVLRLDGGRGFLDARHLAEALQPNMAALAYRS